VFFVDLPNGEARRRIFEIHLGRRKRDPGSFQIDTLVAATEGFSGAEIEQLIIAAMYEAFGNGCEVTGQHLMTQAQTTRPLGVLMRERIAGLRSWAHGRCVSAD
jgi:SpoVK/Ycf46/Vps4 family AAA+-type ATPase